MKTKTGLHIETRKNRIEVFTEKELQKKLEKQKFYKDVICKLSVALLFFLIGLIIAYFL
jgi:Ca2+-dependent lipid-binding protein